MNRSKTYNIVLTTEQLNVVLAGLQEMPHRVSDPVIRNLIGQAEQQSQASAPEPEPEFEEVKE